MTAHARAIAVASIVAIGIASGIASGQSDPTACPAGWQRAFNRIDIPETGRSGAKIRRPLAVDIPASARVMTLSPQVRHPKFCWKESSSARWECQHTDPWEGAWFRFDSFRPDNASPLGLNFKRYSVVAQNESHNRIRNAAIAVCYQDGSSTTRTTSKFKPTIVR